MEEVIGLHRLSKKRINLIYRRANGKITYCYIDPAQPLRISDSTRGYGGDGAWYNAYIEKDPNKKFFVGVYKQISQALVFVEPSKIEFQSEKKAEVSKILYGKRTG